MALPNFCENALTLNDPPALPALYYLDNFLRVVQAVHQQYYDLLTGHERNLIIRFRALNPRSQALLVRMVMRRGSAFTPSQLAYPELGEPTQRLSTLAQQGWLIADPELSAEAFCQRCRLAELRQWAKLVGLKPPARKSDWPEWLSSRYPQPQSWYTWWRGQPPETLYQLAHGSFYELLKLLFFGNFRTGWETFVIADLGHQRFPIVPLNKNNRAFDTRGEIAFSQQLQFCIEAFEKGGSVTQILAELPTEQVRPWLWQRRERLLLRLAEQLEREQQYQAALAYYQQCLAPGARLRHLRLLAKCGHYDRLIAPLQQALTAPEDDAEAMALTRLERRVRKHLPQFVDRLKEPNPVAPKRIQLALVACSARVERAVCEYLHTPEQPILWCENTLWNSLFGLLFWPALYAPIPGAFFHPYQAAPADLYRPDFVSQRTTLFAQEQARLNQAGYQDVIWSRYQKYQGLNNAFVVWPALRPEVLSWALKCIPSQHLGSIFQRMLSDLRHHRSGFPDLIQFDLKNQEYRLYEVKGPGDRIQDHQLRWFHFFAQQGINAEVIDVTWVNDSST